MTIDQPVAVFAEFAKPVRAGWTIRVYPNDTEATMTYHVDTPEDVKRVIEQQLIGSRVRKVEIIGP